LRLVLRGLREQAGYAQRSFATILGYDPSELSRWEGGARVPTGAALATYISVCDLSWEQSNILINQWLEERGRVGVR
jgi:transcriptional regulator with XRE-family HTH domain